MSWIRHMRILLFFDLPTETSDDKKEYLSFRKHLLKNGYSMIQYSVYVKCINASSKFEGEHNKLKKCLPSNGNIRLLCVTEKQYQEMKFLRGDRNINEIYNNEKRYIKI